MSTNKKWLVMKAFTSSQFSYGPLIWMNHSRRWKKATFKELLDKVKAMSIHIRNLLLLVTEMFKVKIGGSLSIMHEIFQTDNSNNFNLRKNRGFNPNPKTQYYGTETISVLKPKLWITLPEEYKNSTSLQEFKTKIKNWLLLNCPCRLCKTYIQSVGLI